MIFTWSFEATYIRDPDTPWNYIYIYAGQKHTRSIICLSWSGQKQCSSGLLCAADFISDLWQSLPLEIVEINVKSPLDFIYIDFWLESTPKTLGFNESVSSAHRLSLNKNKSPLKDWAFKSRKSCAIEMDSLSISIIDLRCNSLPSSVKR